jgi:hypothetical protein
LRPDNFGAVMVSMAALPVVRPQAEDVFDEAGLAVSAAA